MLRACLLSKDEVESAWYSWRSKIDIEKLDPGSHRLLPLLHHNLTQAGIDDPMMKKMKGVYRYHWAQNQLLFHQTAPLLEALQQKGIETMILKGGALVLMHYRDHGLRPMDDIDILIPVSKAKEAINLLLDNRWHLKDEWMTIDKILSRSNAGSFVNERGQAIDVHWYLFPQGRQPHADDPVWSGSVETDFVGVPTRCENATDLLFHVCVHGARWNLTPPIRWIADAMIIFRTSSAEVDWDRLVRQATNRWLTLPLRDTLNYIKMNFNVSVPPWVLETLDDVPHPLIERMEYRLKDKPIGILGVFPGHCFNYLRLVKNSSLRQKIFGFPGYLQDIWGLKNPWQIPLFVVAKLWERIKMRFTTSHAQHTGSQSAEH